MLRNLVGTRSQGDGRKWLEPSLAAAMSPATGTAQLDEFLPGTAPLAYASIIDFLPKLLAGEHAMRAETLLAVAGGLCGFQAQQTGLAWLADGSGPPEARRWQVFVIGTASGADFVMTELVNQLLLSDEPNRLGAFAVLEGKAREAGAVSMPDRDELIRRNASGMGGPEYPPLSGANFRFPPGHLMAATRAAWSQVAQLYDMPQYAGIDRATRVDVMALVAGEIISQTKELVAPDVALQAVMEAAVGMSKIMDLRPAYVASVAAPGQTHIAFAPA